MTTNTDCPADTPYLDLYHRTSAAAAAAIHASGSMVSKEASGDAFFSTILESEHIAGYGDATIHVRVPQSWIENGLAILEDEFELDADPQGEPRYEDHYVIKAALLKPEHFIQ